MKHYKIEANISSALIVPLIALFLAILIMAGCVPMEEVSPEPEQARAQKLFTETVHMGKAGLYRFVDCEAGAVIWYTAAGSGLTSMPLIHAPAKFQAQCAR